MPEERKREEPGGMTVREAGHKGGEKVRELIEKGEKMMEKGKEGQPKEGGKGHRAA